MTSFDSTTATPSELVVPPSKSGSAPLQGPTVASIDSGPVQAYAKLEGDDFCYYIRTLQVTLGRKVSNPENVDILLGNTKSVSRQHARLFFNFSTQRFELMVFGKNGAFVNERFVEKGVTVPLDNKTKIQIGEMAFVFLLPRPETNNVSKNKGRAPRDYGYISTPHQLEKVAVLANIKPKPPANGEVIHREESPTVEDNRSETSEQNNKEAKPPYSYASLIAQAINSTNDKKLTLNGIYNYITTHYPYYQMAQNGWQNSIRHNLSLNKAFVKVPRGDAEPGKGAFWTIDPNTGTQFTSGVYKRNTTTKRTDAPVSSMQSSKNETESPRKKMKKDHEPEDDTEVRPDELIKKDVGESVNPLSITTPTVTLETIQVAMTHPELNSDGLHQANVPADKEDKTDTEAKKQVTPEKSTASPQNPEAQAQLQLQLQNTIRQHLLDPVRYPLPPSIAQLLPQAIAQLPPQLASQLTSTLNTTLKANSEEKTSADKENNPTSAQK